MRTIAITFTLAALIGGTMAMMVPSTASAYICIGRCYK
jgi:hypothetical protein